MSLSEKTRPFSLLRKLYPILLRKPLVKICKSFIRLHIECGEVVYDRASNKPFHQSLKFLQFSTAFSITKTVKGTSSEKLFQKLGLESLKSKGWLKNLCLFSKQIKEESPAYLFQLIPENSTPYTARYAH